MERHTEESGYPIIAWIFWKLMLRMETADHTQNFQREPAIRKKFLKKKKKEHQLFRKCWAYFFSFNVLIRRKNWMSLKQAIQKLNRCLLPGKIRNRELVCKSHKELRIKGAMRGYNKMTFNSNLSQTSLENVN